MNTMVWEIAADTVPAAIKKLRALEPFEGKRVVRLTRGARGEAWALLEVSCSGPERFAVFPLFAGGMRGDTSRQGQAGVRVAPVGMHTPEHAWGVAVKRAQRMFAS